MSVITENVELAIVGCVSSGKSTVLNGITCEQCTPSTIKRNTMVPTIYVEHGESNKTIEFLQPDEIYKIISDKNNELIRLTETVNAPISKENYKEMIFNIKNIGAKLFNSTNDSSTIPHVTIHDIPGLNDAKTKHIYYEYLKENFNRYNIIMFIIDIQSGLNTSDEIDLLKFIVSNTKKLKEESNKNVYTIIVANKCDDMQYINNVLCPVGELEEMYVQIENTVKSEFELNNLNEHLIGFVPLCAKDAYLYRMIEKHGHEFKLNENQISSLGVNEIGNRFKMLSTEDKLKIVHEIFKNKDKIESSIKLSGFSVLEDNLNKFLNSNNMFKTIQVNNILKTLETQPKLTIDSDEKLFKIYHNVYKKVNEIASYDYIRLILESYKEIMNALKEKTNDFNSGKKLLKYYKQFKKTILDTYYSSYSTDKLPICVTNKFVELLLKQIEEIKPHEFSLTVLIDYFNNLHEIDEFNKEKIELIIETVLNKVKQLKTTQDVTPMYHYGTCSDNNFIELLEKIRNENVDVTRILRFVLLFRTLENHAGTTLPNKTIQLNSIKATMYINCNDLSMQIHFNKYLTSGFDMECLINGINMKDYEEDLKLDEYFLKLVSTSAKNCL